jgi:hypothetical protein
MRPTLPAAIVAVGVAAMLAGCGSTPVATVVTTPQSSASAAQGAQPSSPASPAATALPSPKPCTGPEPLPGLCGVGRQATAQEFAAMVAVGNAGVQHAFGWKDWSACSNGETCFQTGDISLSMVGTNAGSYRGGDGLYPGGGLGSACWVFLYQDTSGWHYVNAGCAQNDGFVPGVGAHVFVTGCANVRTDPQLSSKVVACLANNTIVDVDSAPTYQDSHIWWHLAGRGWMAHDFLVAAGTHA